MDKDKFQLEYNLKSSAKILFNRFSTAGGLNEWFADNVQIQGDVFTFEWNGTQQSAKVIKKKPLKYIRFKWIDDGKEDDEVYFEFRLETEELTKELALIITDFAEQDEIEDAKELWDTQIGELKRVMGI